MSRIAGGDVQVVKPTNNVYTALAAIGTVVTILGVVALWMRAAAMEISFF
jgi:hypothetical protein